MTKFKEYVLRMYDAEKQTFDNFQILHDKYNLDQDNWQDEYNREGEKILKVIQEWEDRLCRTSEKAGYASYTGGLSEKFRDEIKKRFTMIDWIGVKSNKEPDFFVKKINLNK